MASFDPLGDTLGGLSVLGQIFTACVRGFEVWQKGKVIAEEATVFQVLLEIQAARFKAWGCVWGIDKNLHQHHPKFQQHGRLAVDCISLIKLQTKSLEALDEKFPVLKLAVDRRSGSLFQLLSNLASAPLSQQASALRINETVSSIETDATIQEKIKWGWEDGKALKKLKILETLIDGLYQILPPPTDDPVAAVVLNSSLASNDTQMLDIIGRQDDITLQSALALIKSTIVKFETRSAVIRDVAIQKPWLQLRNIRNEDRRNSRSTGTYQDSDVLVEWKTVDHSQSPADSLVLDQRIKNVARLLRSDLKPEDLRTLSCLGIVEKVDESETKYGLLYSLPSPSTSHSLRDLISAKRNLLLGDYFTVAHVLSKALLFLHLGGWLHKGIRSDNILFFANKISDILPECPYIVGFEYSRADEQNAMTEDLEDDREFNLYRHPDAQGVPVNTNEATDTIGTLSSRRKGQYRREYDIYSLGVILLELGVRKTVQTIFEQACTGKLYGNHSPERFRSWLLEAIGPQLGTKMGQLYRDATLLCLKGNFDLTGRTLETAFYMDVVKKLEGCHV